MPSGLFQGQGTTEQASAVGINSLQIGPGSPVMNRMEAGGETGGDRNQGVRCNRSSEPRCCDAWEYTASDWNDTCQGLVGGAGTSVGSGASASKCKRTKCLTSATVSFRNVWTGKGLFNGPKELCQNQNFLGCQGHACGGCQGCQGMIGQGMLGQGQGQGLHGQGQGQVS